MSAWTSVSCATTGVTHRRISGRKRLWPGDTKIALVSKQRAVIYPRSLATCSQENQKLFVGMDNCRTYNTENIIPLRKISSIEITLLSEVDMKRTFA